LDEPHQPRLGGSAHSTELSESSNTDIISINQSLIGQLGGNDVRRNYLLKGSIWTRNGSIPKSPNKEKGELPSTLHLSNTSMETYHQNTQCFSCHATDAKFSKALDISHIFGDIEPLDVK
jgi:hypothetical protein